MNEALELLGAAPAKLARLTSRVYSGSEGLTLVLRSGLRAYFGDTSRPHAKWAALAVVLANEGSAEASYIDVRVPERPVAGFPAGTAPSASASSTGATGPSTVHSLSEATVAALAAGLPTESTSAAPAATITLNWSLIVTRCHQLRSGLSLAGATNIATLHVLVDRAKLPA